MDTRTFLTEGVQREDLNPLETALGLTKVPVKCLQNSHRCGSLVRGLTVELPGTTLFPSSLFMLEGFNVALGCYSFPRGAIGSAHSTESALCRCLERKRAAIEAAMRNDPVVRDEMGSCFNGGVSVFRINQNKWGISVRSHNDARTHKLLRNIRGKPLQDCSGEIQENQREAVVGNGTVAAKLAEILGCTLSEESMTIENTVMNSKLLLGASTCVFGSGSNVYVPMLIGTAQLHLTPEQTKGEPFCMPWSPTMGALDQPNEDECFFISLSPAGRYKTLASQHITMQLPVETNVFYAVSPFCKLGFDGHSASYLSEGRADPYHSLAALRAITARLNTVKLLDDNVSDSLREASANLIDSPCVPSTVPSALTLAAAGELLKE